MVLLRKLLRLTRRRRRTRNIIREAYAQGRLLGSFGASLEDMSYPSTTFEQAFKRGYREGQTVSR